MPTLLTVYITPRSFLPKIFFVKAREGCLPSFWSFFERKTFHKHFRNFRAAFASLVIAFRNSNIPVTGWLPLSTPSSTSVSRLFQERVVLNCSDYHFLLQSDVNHLVKHIWTGGSCQNTLLSWHTWKLKPYVKSLKTQLVMSIITTSKYSKPLPFKYNSSR